VQSGLARSLQANAFKPPSASRPAQLRGYRDAGELFPVLAQRIAGIGNAAEEAAIAKRLGIEELLPLLKQGADGFSALAQKAQDLGIVMDSATIEKAAEAKKKLTELDDVMKAKANVSFAQFADTLVDVKQKFLDAELAALSFLAVLTNTVPAAERMKQLRDSIAQKEAGGLGFHPFGNNSGLADQKAELNRLEIADSNAKLKAADAADRRAAPAKPLVPPTAPKASKFDPTPGFNKSATDAYDNGLKALIEAQGALLVDVQLRAASEKAAVDAGLAKKLDDLTAEELKIKASKNDRNKAAQLGEIAVAKAEEEAAAVARRDLIDRQTAEALRQQALAYQQQEIDGQGQLVSLAQGLTFSETLRQKYALELVDLAYQRTRAELEGLIASKTASEAEKRLAQLKLDQLNAQHPLEVENARRTGSAPSQTVNSIVGGIKQQDSRVEQERAAYAEIERLRQQDVLSEREAQQAKYAVAVQYNQARLQAASGFFGDLVGLSQSSNKTLAAIGKAAAIAQATIDGILAVQKALASAPPPFNFALAAAAGVAAAVNVAKIAGLREGGPVAGPGGPRDDKVLRWLSNGEYVVNAPATGRNRPLLDLLNAGGDVRSLLPAPRVVTALSAATPAPAAARGDVHLHYAPNITNPDPNLQRLLENQPRAFRTHLEMLIRNGDIKLT
jgi:hypothetical protein